MLDAGELKVKVDIEVDGLKMFEAEVSGETEAWVSLKYNQTDSKMEHPYMQLRDFSLFIKDLQKIEHLMKALELNFLSLE